MVALSLTFIGKVVAMPAGKYSARIEYRHPSATPHNRATKPGPLTTVMTVGQFNRHGIFQVLPFSLSCLGPTREDDRT